MNFIFLLILSFWSSTQAQTKGQKVDSIIVNANTMEQDTELQKIVLIGNVQTIFQGQHLSCDRATINRQTKEIEAEGNIVVVSQNKRIEGERATLNYETDKGVIYNGVVQMGQVTFEGDVIYKTGPDEFEAHQGAYTACTNCPPAWGITGSTIKGTVGGYAYITNALFRVVRVPIFWLPYLVVPLKSGRQTGFLFPSLEYGENSGFTFAQPFYWVTGKNHDTTITWKHYENRGDKGLLNYRYILAPGSGGQMDFGYIADKYAGQQTEFTTFRQDNHSRLKRSYFRYNHFYSLPDDYFQTTDINWISDKFYPRDFPTELSGHGKPALENRFSIFKNTEWNHFHADSIYYLNLVNNSPDGGPKNPFDDNKDAVHRIPALQFSTTPKRIGQSPFLFQVNTNYVNFARDDRTFDKMRRVEKTHSNNWMLTKTRCEDQRRRECRPLVEDAATFNQDYDPQTDQIRAGQRFDIEPKILYPMKLGSYFDALTALSYREQYYQFGIGPEPSASRKYAKAVVSARTHFTGLYGDPWDPAVDRYKHEIEPYLTYVTIPESPFPNTRWPEIQKHPFFPDGEDKIFKRDKPITELDNIQFDYEDRLFDRQSITYGINNRFIKRRWSNGNKSYHQIGTLKLFQTYDIYEANRSYPAISRPFGDINLFQTLGTEHFEDEVESHYNPYYNRSNLSATVRLIDWWGNFVGTTYTHTWTYLEDTTQPAGNHEEIYTYFIGTNLPYAELRGNISYTDQTDKKDPTTSEPLRHKYTAYGYSIALKPPGKCWALTWAYNKPAGSTEAVISVNFSLTYAEGQSIGGNTDYFNRMLEKKTTN